MRAVVQRVAHASVTADGRVVGAIERGFLVFLGVTATDTDDTARKLAAKVAGLRIFEDSTGKMNLGLADVGGAVLCVSQFTLYGDVRRGKRPSFEAAARPETARARYQAFCLAIEREGLPCERGAFGEHMDVAIANSGPVTLIIDSAALEGPRRA